jgi:hypothetical protein
MFYLDLFASLARHEVRYLLVGGLAMNLHGVPRMTMDVDVLLALDEVNLEHFFAVAEELKLHPTLPVSLKELADPAKRETWIKERNLIAFSLYCKEKIAPTVDVLIGTGLPFEAAYARRVGREINGVAVSLAATEDMIALKSLAGRAQDQADIEHLKRT